jgi:heme oxygenase (biliverdin-IX-beta and delta-forming)
LKLSVTAAKPTTKELGSKLSILQALKQKTAADHRALEETAGIWDCLGSLPSYTKLLIRFRGIYSAAEARLAMLEQLPRWLPDLSRRWKLPALESDLTALGVSSESWLVCTGAPDIRTVAAAFGWLYVFEGSTLGGQMISREVHRQLGLEAQNGCRFFSSYGAEVAPMWKIFGNSLESFCRANSDCRNEIIESAETAFGFFSHTLIGK